VISNEEYWLMLEHLVEKGVANKYMDAKQGWVYTIDLKYRTTDPDVEKIFEYLKHKDEQGKEL
jgi:hypothetical protein